ncbi:zinc-binding dehydrogenase [Paracoccus nototheniae]|uniref:enoyl-[acyl-carrier-protein] reductase n=1 Tax=Paracoccus nototheniae TaxID=2489002 RepID=A0ABW4E4B1_9RHOB|nr:zinc-binding dehydrogenase [Paracoccus nototheniae]
MRSVTHDRFGEPDQVLQTATAAPRPEPQADEILIRVLMAPIHNHDLWTIRGSYGVRPSLPATAGSEAVGIVEATGPGTDPALKGRRVAVAGVTGAWADYAIARAEGTIPVPDTMPDEAAAQLIAMPFSAITLLEFLQVSRGDWVIQTAANGAVGKIMAVLARSRGIRLLNLVRRPEAAEQLAALGMTDIVSTSDPDWVARARAIIGPDGARAAVDSVGGTVAAGLVDLLGTDGLLVPFGSMTGEDLQLPAGPIIFKHLSVKGFWGARIMPATPPADRQRMFAELIGLVMDGTLKLPSGGSFGLDQPAEAVIAALTPGREGKVMFRP